MSTVVDDWGEHAFFSGMPVGSLGGSYVFNGGRSSLTMEEGDDLVIDQHGGQRGVFLRDQKAILSIFCPSLLLDLSLFGIEGGFVIEKGRPVGSEVDWSADYLYEEMRAQGERRKLYTHRSLGTWNRFRFDCPNGGLIKSIVTIDCSECASLPAC
ncbi:hypothetical protein [uncultured Martelella sp.]|uniref:hypothetical protein n=1 Tax=uncultured Martelella sp. TaxID=392331 RepID=UPI0029C68CBE|nr:hypothetical protein [uncultured Martelella sp.]